MSAKPKRPPASSELARTMAELGRLDRTLDALEISISRLRISDCEPEAIRPLLTQRNLRLSEYRTAVKLALLAFGDSAAAVAEARHG